MNMKTKLPIALLILGISTGCTTKNEYNGGLNSSGGANTAPPRTSASGPGAGGGGKGIVCRNADNSIKSVETLDLWEAREIHDEKLAPTTGNLGKDVEAALRNLAKSYPIYFQDLTLDQDPEQIYKLLQNLADKFLKPDDSVLRLRGKRLTDTADAMELVQPENCSPEQIVDYQPDGAQVLVNQDLFEKLNETNQAALIAHEAYYSFLRTVAGESNSIRVRRAVGYAFSGHQFEWQVTPNWVYAPGALFCDAVNDDSSSLNGIFGTGIIIAKDYSQVHFTSIQGTELIGHTSVQTGSPIAHTPDGLVSPAMNNSVEELFNTAARKKKCEKTSAVIVQWFSLGGPVEYDRSIALTRDCDDTTGTITLSSRAPGQSKFVNYNLKCTVHK